MKTLRHKTGSSKDIMDGGFRSARLPLYISYRLSRMSPNRREDDRCTSRLRTSGSTSIVEGEVSFGKSIEPAVALEGDSGLINDTTC